MKEREKSAPEVFPFQPNRFSLLFIQMEIFHRAHLERKNLSESPACAVDKKSQYLGFKTVLIGLILILVIRQRINKITRKLTCKIVG